jgi:2-polyprenyl-6-methoxyphenol hydroxylase-like FAD-dependent oxidoreductase
MTLLRRMGLWHRLRPKRESIEEDYYTDESGSSSVDGSYCARGLPDVEVKLRVPRFAAPTSKF